MKLTVLGWYCAFLILGCFSGVTSAQGKSSPQSDKINLMDLADEAQSRFIRSTYSFLGNHKPTPDRSANDLGWDCLAALSLLDGDNGRAMDKVRSIAGQMAAKVIRSKANDRPIGWSADIQDARCPAGGYDAFGDGTCNSKDTTYAFQTGLGIACLAKASTALADPGLFDIAKDVFNHWQVNVLPKVPCKECLYFATSDNPNDAGRYVRNMNVFMAYGAAALGRASGKTEFINIANQAMRSELAERKSQNRGYLGKLDPQWRSKAAEADRIENHSAAIAVLSVEIGHLLHSEEIKLHGLTVWRDWATCDNEQCRKAGCNYWAGNAEQCQATYTAAHCAFRQDDPLAASQCSQYLLRAARVPSFGVWATFLGYKNDRIAGRRK